MHLLTERSAKERFDEIARDSGLSAAQLFERMVARLADDVDPASGAPTWLPADERREELPIGIAS